ncbi:hypothetical protein Htur_0445 [Haloterrigena turkmenica DSM 5511]|uniref:Uncharacterized protein n=1 Tax=Haloterrigena turkmenica (strain ATCC 51198 / DSM 5511 / JCM 9101 / NCIMB 13204 / VKM B-1734 / 4k) TaxID=543526 RepID=D2RVH9_HALTV|nr:hypothetical protein Htur_0445 [Haloterrigena turkmenica DSM 5511]
MEENGAARATRRIRTVATESEPNRDVTIDSHLTVSLTETIPANR